ncbi:MAG: iron-containing redox enzyme family protein [Aeromicrobium sp.]
MRLPAPRGPYSEELFDSLANRTRLFAPPDELADDDRHIALWALYELHYRGFAGVDEDREWDPVLLRARAGLEAPFEADLRARSAEVVKRTLSEGSGVVEQLGIIATRRGSGLPTFLERSATEAQFAEFLTMRSVYTLKESDPHAWALPRITHHAKAALAELLYDEFGSGSGNRVHQELFAAALREAGLDPIYGALVDQAPAHVLAVNNAMSLFGLHHRLRGALLGHLAAFEMTSTTPCRRIAKGAQRLGLGPAVLRYYEEHIEADAVHEQLASRSICGALVDAEPALHDDVLLGAATCVVLEKTSGIAMLKAWADGRSALR